jgi:hypothetical protein
MRTCIPPTKQMGDNNEIGRVTNKFFRHFSDHRTEFSQKLIISYMLQMKVKICFAEFVENYLCFLKC